jgi:succinate dehydrogenase / fumarate reductase flavoprotein subunit
MQGLADGYFVVPLTIGNYLGSNKLTPVSGDDPAVRATEQDVRERTERLLAVNGGRTVTSIHRELGQIMWEYCGMARDAAGLTKAIGLVSKLRDEFWRDVRVPGTGAELNQALEHAGRVADFLELGELMCRDALDREESCGAHFRTEYETADGEAKRDDERFAYVAAWEYAGQNKTPVLHKEPLVFENVALSQRSYK